MISENAFSLTLEQQLRMRQLSDAAEKASQEQLKELFLDVAKQLMIKENCLKDIMKREMLKGL